MLLQTVALLNLAGPDGAKVGLALGSATSAGLIIFYLKRAIDTGWYSLVPHAHLSALLTTVFMPRADGIFCKLFNHCVCLLHACISLLMCLA